MASFEEIAPNGHQMSTHPLAAPPAGAVQRFPYGAVIGNGFPAQLRGDHRHADGPPLRLGPRQVEGRNDRFEYLVVGRLRDDK